MLLLPLYLLFTVALRRNLASIHSIPFILVLTYRVIISECHPPIVQGLHPALGSFADMLTFVVCDRGCHFWLLSFFEYKVNHTLWQESLEMNSI